MVISGTSILFIDPLYEEIDPKKVCCQVSISDFVQQDVCGPQGLEADFVHQIIKGKEITKSSVLNTLCFSIQDRMSQMFCVQIY